MAPIGRRASSLFIAVVRKGYGGPWLRSAATCRRLPFVAQRGGMVPPPPPPRAILPSSFGAGRGWWLLHAARRNYASSGAAGQGSESEDSGSDSDMEADSNTGPDSDQALKLLKQMKKDFQKITPLLVLVSQHLVEAQQKKKPPRSFISKITGGILIVLISGFLSVVVTAWLDQFIKDEANAVITDEKFRHNVLLLAESFGETAYRSFNPIVRFQTWWYGVESQQKPLTSEDMANHALSFAFMLIFLMMLNDGVVGKVQLPKILDKFGLNDPVLNQRFINLLEKIGYLRQHTSDGVVYYVVMKHVFADFRKGKLKQKILKELKREMQQRRPSTGKE